MKVHQIKIDFQVTEQVKRYVYVYLIEAEHCYLIDSGVYQSQDRIIEQLHKIGRDVADVKGIFLTHAHPDHIGTAAWFKKETGCKIYASAGEKRWIENIDLQYKERPIPNFYNLAGESVSVDVTIKDGDQIALEDGLTMEVIGTAGHSCEEVSYKLNDRMFTGDSIPVKGDIPIYIDVEKSLSSLERISAYEECAMFYPAWDQTYSKEKLGQKIKESTELIQMIDAAVSDADAVCTGVSEITNHVCDILGKPMLLSNPLFQRTIQAHMTELQRKKKGFCN